MVHAVVQLVSRTSDTLDLFPGHSKVNVSYSESCAFVNYYFHTRQSLGTVCLAIKQLNVIIAKSLTLFHCLHTHFGLSVCSRIIGCKYQLTYSITHYPVNLALVGATAHPLHTLSSLC